MLADMIGCRIESAIRQMSQWEKDRGISTDESRITILRPDKLYSLAGKTPDIDF
jgi:CRP-like cAMP-binding protein